jgi:hypothetical protein
VKLVATRKADQNEAAVDPWTAVHFGAGLALGLVGAPFAPVVLGAVAYELGEQIAERTKAAQSFFRTSGPERPVNAVVDVAVMLGGWWLGNRYNKPVP